MSLVPFDGRDGWIWLDGQFVPWREAKVHVLTHGLHYASSVFEGERMYGGEIFKLTEHTERLFKSAETMDFTTAASLGCRFVTSFRAVVDQGKTSAGQWVAVHGCGGVGLSAIMIANAVGANVVAVDISEDKLAMARALGAVATVNASEIGEVAEAVIEITRGGAHVSLDALGHPTTCFNSISNLRKRGKHVQVGLMLAENSTPAIPMSRVIAQELEILGSHGMQAYRYDAMLEMMRSGKLAPEKLVGRTITLEQSIDTLMNMDRFEGTGVTVVTEF